MRRFATAFSALIVAGALAPASARAQHAPPLHVDPRYDSCSFDLHSELTEGEFEEFAEEVGSIMRFRQLGDPAPLGKGRFELSAQFASSSIDDTKGAWNNTMSHPNASHPLGDTIAFPRLVVRYGVSDRVDLGAWGGLDPNANYGFAGIDTKIAVLRQGPSRPVTVSIRPSVTAMFGPSEVWAANSSIDISVSRAFGPVSPYVGVATTASVAYETSDDVDLDPATADGSLAYAGVAYRWRSLLLAAEVETGALSSYGIRIGTRF